MQSFRSIQLPFRTNTSPEAFLIWSQSMNTEAGNMLKMHQNMNDWFLANGTYKADGIIDYPRHYLITHAWKSGDCDDWSSMFMAAAYKMKYNVQFIVVGTHAVCMFHYKDFYYHNSNWKGVRGPFFSIQDVAYSINPNWVKISFYSNKFVKINEVLR